MGAIFTEVVLSYPGQEAKASGLLTYPTLYMGIGNLIGMPLALVIGRRPVYIANLVFLLAGGIWCACSKSLDSHLAGRAIMSLAAGNSEALVQMMVQEIHFLHERGTKLGWVSAMQALGTAAFFLAQGYLVADMGWRWWYGLFTIINGAVFFLSLVLVPETGYDRPDEASEGHVHVKFNKDGTVDEVGELTKVVRVTTAHGNVLDMERFSPRTWKHDLSFFVMERKWSRFAIFYKQLLQALFIPTMFWLVLLNGAFLGLYVLGVSTFGTVLLAPPFNFAFTALGYVQAGQIADSILFLPIVGYGTDLVIKFMSKRNNGVYQPEYRLIILIVPAVVGVVCSIMYGQTASYPDKYTWGSVAVTYNAIFFAFLGANVVGLTYAIDSFPLAAGPLLVLICAGRGFISFGLSYATLPATQTLGFATTFNIFAIITGVLSLLAVPFYFYGRQIRRLGMKWFGEEEHEG